MSTRMTVYFYSSNFDLYLYSSQSKKEDDWGFLDKKEYKEIRSKKNKKGQKMVNYQDGRIYRIICNITGKQYIGSTTTSLSQRLAKHRHSYAFWKRGEGQESRHFTSSYEILENGDFDIILIEDYPCDNKEQLCYRERYWIEQMDCVNRIKRPMTNDEERRTQSRLSVKNWNEIPF